MISTVLLGSGVGFTGIGTGTEAWASASLEEPPALEGPPGWWISRLPPLRMIFREAQAVEPESPRRTPRFTMLLEAFRNRGQTERALKSPLSAGRGACLDGSSRALRVGQAEATGRGIRHARTSVWVSGGLGVPPANSIWVESRWRRDADGWHVPGFSDFAPGRGL